VSAVLKTKSSPAKAAQTLLLNVDQDQLRTLATKSDATASVLTTALAEPSLNIVFHKILASKLVPLAPDVIRSPCGKHVVRDLVLNMPTARRGDEKSGGSRNIPFHVKEAVMAQLAAVSADLEKDPSGSGRWVAP